MRSPIVRDRTLLIPLGKEYSLNEMHPRLAFKLAMKLKVTATTVFKHSPRQSSDLPDAEKRAVSQSETFALTHQEPADGNHLKVTLAEPLGDRTVWYVYAPHVQMTETSTALSSPPAEEDDQELDVAGAIGCSTFLGIVGMLCLFIPLMQVVSVNPASVNPETEERSGLNGFGWAGLLIGLPTTAIGAWYGIDSVIRGRQNQEKRVKDAFYGLLEANNGESTVLQFAQAADLPGDEARAYLDERAKEFNATFEVEAHGGITYHFR